MRKIGVVFLISLLWACTTDSTDIGSDFFNGGSLDLSLVDSSTVNLSTIQVKKMQTNAAGRVLLGSHIDERLGRITASVYFQAGVSSAVDFSEDLYDFSHAAVVLRYDEYSYYDTTALLKLNVHLLAEDLKLEGGALYTTDAFSVEGNVIGTTSLHPRPHRDDSLEIRLSDNFGRALFAKAKAGDDDLQSNSEFVKYIHGFCIAPDSTTSGPMIGFTTAPELRLYYYDKSVVPTVLDYASFPVNAGYYGTHFFADRTGTPLVGLGDVDKRLSSSETDDVAFLQGGGGLSLRVDMPYLRSLAQFENIYVTRAILDVYTIRKSDTDLTPMPSSMSAFEINKGNSNYSDLEYTVTLLRDTDLSRDTHYEIDVTNFVKTQMAMEEFNENALLVTMSGDDFTTSAGRIFFASPGYEYKTRLRIYYATINE